MPASSGLRYVLSGLAGASTVVVIAGATLATFLNPIWIGFAQERAGVAAITGYTPDRVRTVTGSILSDLVFGPPAFGATVDGRPVLDALERSHMVDVRNVLLPFVGLFVLATAVLAAILASNRRDAWAWRATARAAGALSVAGAAVGIAVVFFFEAAFVLFHLIFFPGGNFSFDPRTERLTQLFPQQFWTETAIGIALVGLALALAVTIVARRLSVRVTD